MFSAEVVGKDGAATVVRLAGELDIATAPQVTACLSAVGDGDIIVDVAGLTFLDSSGLSVLLAAYLRASDRGFSFVVQSPSSCVSRVLQVSGVDHLLKIAS